MTKRDWFIRGSAAVLLTTMLAACGGGAQPSQPQPAAQNGQSPAAAPGDGGTIVFSGYGGDYEDAMRKYVIEPFQKKYNAKVIYDSNGSSTEKLAKMKASKGTYLYDVAVLIAFDSIAGGKEGLLEQFDDQKLPNLAKLYPIAKQAAAPWAPVTSFDPLVLLYNKEKVTPAPDSWTALWDAKYKGKVAISHVSEGKGLYFLTVAARLGGGSLKNMDPGFAKVQELVPSVSAWLTASTQYPPYFESGEIWMAPYWNGRAQVMADQMKVAAVVPKEGTVAIANTFAVPATAKNKELAWKFVNFYLEATQQQAWAEKMYYSPVNTEVKLSGDIAKRVVYGPEQIAKMELMDDAYVNTVKKDWIERWNKGIQDAQKYAK